MKKTTIILAANGVVFVDPLHTPDLVDAWGLWESTVINGQSLAYAPELIQALNNLQAREDVEFRWLTSWGEDIRALQGAIGLHGLWDIVERIEPKGSAKLSKSSNGYWRKFDAFKQEIFTRPLRRLIWADPEVEDHEDKIDNWLDPYGVLEDDRLYLAPDPERGLTPKNLDAISGFINP